MFFDKLTKAFSLELNHVMYFEWQKAIDRGGLEFSRAILVSTGNELNFWFVFTLL